METTEEIIKIACKIEVMFDLEKKSNNYLKQT